MAGKKKEKAGPGLKSALDLAMARLDREEGAVEPLTDGQKEALAEIDSQARARIAELEILMGDRMAAARSKGDAEEVRKLEDQRSAEMAKLRDRAERDKARVRRTD